MDTFAASALASVVSLLPATALASEWSIDAAHSRAGFSVRHLMVSNVRGGFDQLAGTVRLDEQEPSRSSVEATIQAASINTHEPKRDAHLRSADFFDVEKFPTLSFKSRKVARQKDGGYRVIGDLTLHGVTREVTLVMEEPTAAVKDPWGGTRRGLTATTKVNRKDFGLGWNVALEAGGVLVGEEVSITLDVELIAQPPKPAAK